MYMIRGTNEGDLYALFIERVYDKLPVNGIVVFDIGEGVAETSIIFL